MVREILHDARQRMDKAVEVLRDDLASIRSGRASPALVEKLPVDYYGTPTPLMQLASITAPEPRMLVIRPFDPNSMGMIERAILTSDLGVNPNNDGQVIRLVLPPLTEERRRDLVRLVHKRVEEARIAVRNIRRDAIADLRDLEKEKMISEDEYHRLVDRVDEMTKEHIERINELGERKEEEIMEV
ncbi:MAG: ribosome recycling factor [Chloroflexi bacterium]|nr:ribosome recycling factor [Chloroflexota bacterium]